MPNTASAKKRLRQNAKRRLYNRSQRSELRGQLRKVRDAVQAGDGERAQSEYRLAQKKLDQAAAKGIVHKNAAARTKGRMIRLLKSV
jgi:small subunit ribosomal protein S20